jgi:hypothetical protein
MSQDEMFCVGRALPKVVAVDAAAGLTVKVTWASGVNESVDLSPIILQGGGMRLFDKRRND